MSPGKITSGSWDDMEREAHEELLRDLGLLPPEPEEENNDDDDDDKN